MNAGDENEIKKEFQLERIIFFSDAVFAIIITIMVLDVKLPDVQKYTSEGQARGAFLQLLPRLITYILTFFMVGGFWIRHLRIFSFLKDYNPVLVVLNLVFLLSVSLYPFAQSFAFNGSDFMNYDTGAFVYICIIYFSTFTQAVLTGYLIKNKASLCLKNDEIEMALKWHIVRLHYFFIPIAYALLACTIYFGFTHRVFYGFIAIYFLVIRLAKIIHFARHDRSETVMGTLFGRRKKTAQHVNPKPKRSDSGK